MPQLDTDLSAVGAGLDALDAPSQERRPSWRKRFVRTAVPPLIAFALLLGVWQALWALAFWPEYQLPAPRTVWAAVVEAVETGRAFEVLWTSVSRAVLGFLTAVVIATPLGLLIAKVRVVRRS